MVRWPNLFIVGANKAGTTSLYEYLKNVPEIYMSPIKEPSYFSEFGQRKFGKITEDGYLSLFTENVHYKFIGEATSVYLHDPETPLRIYDYVPDARIIILLRNPIERTFSHYWYISFNRGYGLYSFQDIIQKEYSLLKSNTYNIFNLPTTLLLFSFYYDYVKRYIDIFGKNHVHIMISEEFSNKTKDVLNTLLEWLDVKYRFSDKETFPTYNTFQKPKSKLRFELYKMLYNKLSVKLYRNLPFSMRMYISNNILPNVRNAMLITSEKPLLSAENRKFLKIIFEDDVKKLEILLNRKLPWCDFH